MKLNKKALAILSAAHLVTDVNQGVLPALLPFFKEALNLSYTMSGFILLSANITSSIIQPEGFKTAYYFTGDKRATGMSIFAVGGNFGIAVGPILALTLVTSFGLQGTLSMILLVIVIGVILILNMKMLTTPVEFAHREAKKEMKMPLSRNQKISFTLLVSIATVRAWIQFGLVTYIPFYYINYLKGNPLYAGKLVSTFLMAGVVGKLIGAPLADRGGHKKFLLTTLFFPFPLMLLFYYSSGPMAFVFSAVTGMGLISTFALTTVMGQALLPHRLGMASGMMVGFTISAGGMGGTLLGAIADTWGVPAAIKT